MLALGFFDIIVILPVQIVSLVIDVGQGPIDFWPGWSEINSDWAPVIIPKSEWSKDRWVSWGIG